MRRTKETRAAPAERAPGGQRLTRRELGAVVQRDRQLVVLAPEAEVRRVNVTIQPVRGLPDRLSACPPRYSIESRFVTTAYASRLSSLDTFSCATPVSLYHSASTFSRLDAGRSGRIAARGRARPRVAWRARARSPQPRRPARSGRLYHDSKKRRENGYISQRNIYISQRPPKSALF